MRAAVITIAGISSRFNKGIPEDEKVLKAIYTDGNAADTLLARLLAKVSYADRIVIVGGYRYADLTRFFEENLKKDYPQAYLVENPHYADLASGYSLWLGVDDALNAGADEVLFVEGDLDIDDASFSTVVEASGSVLTYTSEPIYADKAVVLYRDADGRYRYAFNRDHGMLRIDEPFSCILNSGQTWKFTDAGALRRAAKAFMEQDRGDTNLGIIRRYIDDIDPASIELVFLKRWTNCNTKEDYLSIRKNWRSDK